MKFQDCIYLSSSYYRKVVEYGMEKQCCAKKPVLQHAELVQIIKIEKLGQDLEERTDISTTSRDVQMNVFTSLEATAPT